jgi:branched-chain amino acid transport system substrate-binding protein
MKIKRRALWIALALIISVLLVFSCAKKKETYKVGAIFSVTGRTSFLGEPEKKTAEMIAEAINKVGGINGHPLELIILDDESDETKAVLAANRLIKKDKVPVVIGPSLSGNTLAVVKIFNEAKIPLVSAAASNKIVIPVAQRHWIFKVPQSDTHAVEKIYDYLLKNGITKIAIMSVSTGFGASGREELLRLAPEVGIEIMADERYGPKDTDVTAQLTRIRGTDAKAIVNWSVGPTQVFCPLGRVNIPDLVPADNPQKKIIDIYNKAYQEKYNEPVSSFGGHGWDALNLVIEALTAVGPDSAKIRDYIETRTNFVGQHGVFNFSATDHNGLTKEAFEMVVVKDGDWALAP